MNEQSEHRDDPQMDKAQRIAYLVAAYIRNTITPLEHDELDDWVGESDQNMKLFEELTDEKKIKQALNWMDDIDSPRALRKVKEQLTFAHYYTPRRVLSRGWQYAAAACLVLVVGAAAWLLLNNNKKKESGQVATVTNTVQDLQPGSTDKAILTLNDGTTIPLDQAQEGIIAMQGSSEITKHNGQILYNSSSATPPGELLFNTMTTPRGANYTMTLSDGTKVWLNASSSIRFPARFAGAERRVTITGEVYFEVASFTPRSPKGEPRRKMPFIVEVKDRDMKIEVLGTHFNINSYSDESAMKTTLLEGAVKVVSGQKVSLLKPGQQASVENGEIKTATADVDGVMAWKNGQFRFRNTDLQTIMKQVSRWYDVEIEFETKNNPAYNSILKKDIPASQLFAVLEENGGVHFRIEGKKVRVLP